MNDYTIKRGDLGELDLIRPLWEQLNSLHHDLSPHFKERFRNKTWEKRKQDMILKSKEIMLDYVVDGRNGRIVGYCISSIEKSDDKTGEIDSIFIDGSCRKTGIGKQLMERAVDWLISRGTEVQKLLVGVGNEQVFDFYRQFDFYPLHIILQRKKN